jgi:hypothetical protein
MKPLIIDDLKHGSIYSINYSKDLQIIAMYSHSDITEHIFFNTISYTNGYEISRALQICVDNQLTYTITNSTLIQKENYDESIYILDE